MFNKIYSGRGFVCVAAFFLMQLIACAGYGPNLWAAENKINVAIATWPGFAAGFVGQDKGFFSGLSVKFSAMDDSRARHAAFQSGRIDVMVSSADVFAQELGQGIKGVLFLVTDESSGGDGIVAKPEIKNLADLRGRRVAFARATPSHYFLFKVLERAGIAPGDIEPVIVEDPGHAGQAFVGGSVDAAVTWEPLLSQAQESGKGHIIATTRDMPATVVDVLIATPEFASQTDVLASFIGGWLKSVAYIQEHPKEAEEIIAKGLNLPPEEVQGMMGGLRFAGVDRNRYFLCEPRTEMPRINEILRDAAAFWKSQNLIGSIPSIEISVSTLLCETEGIRKAPASQ